MKYLITIVGPTAIGKTSLSIALAQHFNCEIISCDSRQFFKEMTIGTAVPNQLELSSAKHHFIHNKSIFEVYNVGDFEKEAILKLEGLYTNNDFVILVGGSGLYVDAILKGFDAIPEIEKTIRENIKLKYELNGIKFLIESLKKLDPNYYTELSQNNPQTLLNHLSKMSQVPFMPPSVGGWPAGGAWLTSASAQFRLSFSQYLIKSIDLAQLRAVPRADRINYLRDLLGIYQLSSRTEDALRAVVDEPARLILLLVNSPEYLVGA